MPRRRLLLVATKGEAMTNYREGFKAGYAAADMRTHPNQHTICLEDPDRICDWLGEFGTVWRVTVINVARGQLTLERVATPPEAATDRCPESRSPTG